MTTPSPRPGQLVRKIELYAPKVSREFLYPVVTGILRIIWSLLKNSLWLVLALLTFLIKGLYEALNDVKNMKTEYEID